MFYLNFVMKHIGLKLILGATVLGLVVVCATQPAPAQTETLLYSFGAYTGDADWPDAGLVMDTNGNLYGTTYAGGAYDYGTVFELTPAGEETVLYSFGSQPNDGEHPESGLIMDKKGNLYGTTYWGGANGEGTVFKLTPAGKETVLYSFKGYPDGGKPVAGLIMDKNKNLYGTTSSGGAHGSGAVFEVTQAGAETLLYSFLGTIPDGNTPYGGLIMDTASDLYGTTFYGGADNLGTVFKLTKNGTETVLHSFAGYPGDGEYPLSGLVMDKKNNLYGTTVFGGADNDGIVFEISPHHGGSAWTETILHTFTGEPGDGQRSFGGLIMDKAGNLYGTTYYGGAYNNGTVFEITP